MDMGLDLFTCTKQKSCNSKVRQRKCEKIFTKPNMGFSSPIISIILHFLILVCPINSLKTSNQQLVNQTFRSNEELHKLKKMIAARLQQINKPAVKTIQSPDGDIIDCILTHKQLAFDHPLLKGQKPLDPPERPTRYNQMSNFSDNFQLWSLSGESCPDGTIPVRRITEQDLLRADSISGFGRKFTNTYKHTHAVALVEGGGFHGAKATINVWAPQVESPNEFSLAQMWITSGTYEKKDVNAIEAGWQVCEYAQYLLCALL
ncbi:putative neprosin [Medicago truncatula]|uniref:Putative neprosin n=1 Tax=Medicago truncatula TaxID=3880 RepID=A0A396GQ30_MEDTR|nr:putative neprosin [Medicago truncatula]